MINFIARYYTGKSIGFISVFKEDSWYIKIYKTTEELFFKDWLDDNISIMDTFNINNPIESKIEPLEWQVSSSIDIIHAEVIPIMFPVFNYIGDTIKMKEFIHIIK